MNRFIFTIVIASIFVLSAVGQTVQSIQPPSGSVIDKTDPDQTSIIGICITSLTSADNPDAMVATNIYTSPSDAPAISISDCRYTGMSVVKDEGFQKICEYYFLINMPVNTKPCVEYSLYANFDYVLHGQPIGRPVSCSYTVKQNTSFISPGSISANQSIDINTTPQQLKGTHAIYYNKPEGRAYVWLKDDGAGWSEIPNSNAVNYQPPALSVKTKYKRKAKDLYGQAESNEIIISMNRDRGFVTDNRNHIVSYDPFTQISLRDSLTSRNVNVSISYHDGLGRPEQNINIRATPLGGDIVTPIVYNVLEKDDAISYLPYVVTGKPHGLFQNNPLQDQNSFYRSLYTLSDPNAYAFRVNEYEKSTLGRIAKKINAGRDFYFDNVGIRAEPISQKNKYLGNWVEEVLIMNPSSTGIAVDGYYAQGALNKVTQTDENNNRIEVFTNSIGNTVLERRYITADQTADVYFVYDKFDFLNYVIQPKGSVSIDSCYSQLDQNFINLYCFVFNHDMAGNIIYQKNPQVYAQHSQYNNQNLLTLKQIGEKNNLLYDYDIFNRIIKERYVYVEGVGRSIENTLREVSYDTYPAGAISFQVNALQSSYDNRTKGFKTHERLRFLEKSMEKQHTSTDKFIERTFYYDKKGRLLQTVERNQLGGLSIYTNQYDFAGNITASLESHATSPTAVGDSKTTYFAYDNQGRLLNSSTKVMQAGIESESASVARSYDELGRLAVEKLGNAPYAISQSYKYTMQGWLSRKDVKGANNSLLFLTGLSYYDPIHVGSKSLYNGNISEMMWRQGANQLQSYIYSYDGMSRLTNTHHLSNLVLADQNVEQNIRYDFNSNICSMTRINNGVNEYFTADCYGNQDINNNYDKRGNIVAINAKEVFMDYNLLNLPSQIKHYYEPEGSTTDYVYLTDGRKLTANFNGGEGLEYLGSFVYLRNAQGGLSLESTDFAAGRIENSTTGYKVNYHLTDHLSSVRAIATSTGAGTPPTITSRMDYHPFGTPHASSPLPTATQKHRYTFCGKEEQRIVTTIPAQFELAVMDQGARYYIPNTMQFTSQDPLAIKYPHISPYTYCAANPILYVDPTGMEWIWNSNNNDMRWDDNVKSEKDIPKGYVYIGNNNSLLSFFNFPNSTQSQSSNKIGFVAFDTNVGMHMINVKEKSNVLFTVNVTSDKKNITANNKSGKIFNGVDITITNESSNSGTDGNLSSSSSVGEVIYGNDKYQQYLTSPSGYNFRTTGTTLTQTTINIPGKSVSPSSNLLNISVSGSWWVSRPEGRTPVVIHGLIPIPLTYKHQWK